MEHGTKTGEGAPGKTPNAGVQAAVAQLWEVIRKAGELLVATQDDNRALAARVAGLEQQIGEQQTGVAGALGEAESLRHELEQRDADIAVLRTAVEQAERDLAAAVESAGELRDRTERYEETIRRLTLRISDQDDELAALRNTAEDYRQAQAELAVTADREAALHAVADTLRSELAAARAEAKDAEFLRAELVRRNTELNARIKEAMHHRERAAELENKLYDLQKTQSALRETRHNLDSLHADLDAAVRARTEAEERAVQAEERMRQSEEQAGQVAGRHAELLAQLEESRNMEQELLVRLQQAHDDADAVRRRAEEQQKHVVELSGQLIGLKAMLPDYEARNRELALRVDSLTAELESLRLEAGRVYTAEADREAMEQARRKAEEQRTQAERECAALRDELREVAHRMVSRDLLEEREAQIADLLAQVQESEREIERLRHRLDNAHTVGSLFTAQSDTVAEPAVQSTEHERRAIIESVQALLKKVERALEPGAGSDVQTGAPEKA